MSELYSRRLTVTVTAKGIARTWTDLDVQFRVEQTAGSDPNKAEVVLYNLSADSRRLVSDSAAVLTLSAGYPGTEAVIFRGDVDQVQNSSDGADSETRVTCSDGGRALRSTVVNVSTSKDSPVSSVVDDLLAELGLPKGSVAVLEGALKQGLAYVGPAKKLLDELVSSAGARWSVQDGEAQVHPVTGTPEPIVVLSVASGMVGVPERFVEDDKASGVKRSGVRVKSLLQPGIRPGRRGRVTSDWVSGDFVAEKVSHSGDTVGADWYTDVEAY